MIGIRPEWPRRVRDLPHHVGRRRLIVPVNAQLDAKAFRWNPLGRQGRASPGRSAMVLFASDANAAILKGLLDDFASRSLVIHEGGRESDERVYSIREEATYVLKARGCDVPRRVLRGPMPAEAGSAPPPR